MSKNWISRYKKTTAFCLALVIAIVSFRAPRYDTSRTGSHRDTVISSDTNSWPKSFGFGRAASKTEIAAVDIAIRPNGIGLPPGSGNTDSGRKIYELKCIACHGKHGRDGPFSPLVGAMGDTIKAKTIGNYWPYATTLFDYIRRAMPFNQPGSLTSNEVYSLTAYLLYKNKITDPAMVLNAINLPKITMPAKHLFVNDDRHGGPEIK